MFDLNLIDFENISIRLHSSSSMVKILHRYEHANHHETQCFDADPIQPVLNWFNPFHSNDECDVLCMKQVRHEMIFMVFFFLPFSWSDSFLIWAFAEAFSFSSTSFHNFYFFSILCVHKKWIFPQLNVYLFLLVIYGLVKYILNDFYVICTGISTNFLAAYFR